MILRPAGRRKSGAALVAIGSALLLCACKDPVQIDAKVTRFTVQTNPVPAPTATAPSEFTLEWAVDTQGDGYGYLAFFKGPGSPTDASTRYEEFLSGSCSDGCDNRAGRRVTCRSALSSEGSDKRDIQCDDPSRTQLPATWKAGTSTVTFSIEPDPKYAMHDHVFGARSEVELTLK